MSKLNDRQDNCAVTIDRPPAAQGLKPILPRNYPVVLLNDDFTPMDFVVMLLTRLFGRSPDEAESILNTTQKV